MGLRGRLQWNTFLANAGIRVGEGSELLEKVGLYPKHDLYVGVGKGMTTTVKIRRNAFYCTKRVAVCILSNRTAKPFVWLA
jgi:hypothetical protein